jgi:hypothetical protein
MLKVLGPLLLVAGLAGLWLGGIDYTTREKVLEAGPLKLESESRETFEVPPLAAGVVAAIGGALTAVAFRRR